MKTQLTEYSPEFLQKMAQLKADMHKKYVDIGAESTPQMDGSGRQVIKQKGTQDYIEEAYMRKTLDKHFPGWSWEMASSLHFLGAEWVVAQGHLVIIDEYLLGLGIVPPIRKFYGVDAVRIQYKQGSPHTPENLIDIGDNCQSASAGAFKRAINRLTFIGDDVYGKRIEEEGAGNLEDIILATENSNVARDMFQKYVSNRRLLISKVCETLDIKQMSEITDFREAYSKLVEAEL